MIAVAFIIDECRQYEPGQFKFPSTEPSSYAHCCQVVFLTVFRGKVIL